MRPKHSLRETKRLGGCGIKFRGEGCALLYPRPTWCILLSTLYTASAFSTPFPSIHPTNPPGYYPRLLRAFIALTADVALLCGQEFAFGWRTLTPSSCSFFRQLPYFPPCVNCVCEPRNQSVALCLLACRQRPPAWSNWQRGAGRHVVAPRPMVLARACLLAGETWWHHLWQVEAWDLASVVYPCVKINMSFYTDSFLTPGFYRVSSFGRNFACALNRMYFVCTLFLKSRIIVHIMAEENGVIGTCLIVV